MQTQRIQKTVIDIAVSSNHSRFPVGVADPRGQQKLSHADSFINRVEKVLLVLTKQVLS